MIDTYAQYEQFSHKRRFIEADQADEKLRETIRRLTEGKKGGTGSET